jgi:hypothetical protein
MPPSNSEFGRRVAENGSLSLRVKDGNVRSVVFKSGVDGFTSSNPDFRLMRKRVKAAIGESKNPKAAKKAGVDAIPASANGANVASVGAI